jgi:hypothetical protein
MYKIIEEKNKNRETNTRREKKEFERVGKKQSQEKEEWYSKWERDFDKRQTRKAVTMRESKRRKRERKKRKIEKER